MDKLATVTSYLTLLCLMPLVSGCSAIEAVFKAGMWVGVIAVVGAIALLALLIRWFGKRNS